MRLRGGKGRRTRAVSARSARLFAAALVVVASGLALAVPAEATLPEAEKRTVAPIVRAIVPGVVNIATRSVERVNDPLLQDPDIQELFGIPDSALRREVRSAGSGVIVDAERGYILTNDHVVKNATAIEVTTKDNRRFHAELVGHDQATDIAVLHIKADNLTAVPFGDSSKTEVGDFVLAIGNPYGLGQTVTSGIVSALGRTGLGIEGYEDFIQTDASINPGNSGGALATLDGRLVGINTAILSRSGGNVGIGFAVPINMARQVMEQIIAHGEVLHGSIGVSIEDVAREVARTSGTPHVGGAAINRVMPGSPAEQAGLAKGDVIVAVNGTSIKNAAALRNIIGLLPSGSEIDVSYDRKGSLMTARLRIEAQSRSRESAR